MISLTVFENDARGFNTVMHNFICNSFTLDCTGNLTIHFDNGNITIGKEAFADIVVYPHNTVDTDVFNPSLV